MDKTKQTEKILEKYGIDNYHWKPEIAKEIAALYVDYYPKEFVEWKDYIVYMEDDGYCLPHIGSSLDEVYQYWQDNVKDK